MSLTMRAMKSVMFKVSKSKHDFEQTVEMVRENAARVAAQRNARDDHRDTETAVAHRLRGAGE